MATYHDADRAMAKYEATVLAGIGRKSPAVTAEIELREVEALFACEEAATDRTVNQATRDHYRKEADWFRAQVEDMAPSLQARAALASATPKAVRA